MYNIYGDIMSDCEGNCITCKSECNHRCPVCHGNAINVSIETVKSILKDNSELIIEDIYICLNRKCDVTYFNTKQYYLKDELKVPIWFKENPMNMIVCYCYGITLKMIINATKLGYTNKEQIIKYYNLAKKHKDCLHLNPIGKKCDALFENVIIYAKGENK